MTGTFISGVVSFFGGIQTYLIVGAIVAVLGLTGGFYAGYRWEHSAATATQLAEAQAVTKAVSLARASDAAQAKVGLSAALSEAAAQTKIATQTAINKKEIPHYVTVKQDSIACVPVGLARIMRSASAGTDPSTLGVASGQSDDACSDVTASEMASWFASFAGASQANSEQLNALEAWVTANHAAQASVK